MKTLSLAIHAGRRGCRNYRLSSTVNGVTTTYTYDNNGNLLSSQEGSSAPIQYSYNVANQLVGMNDTARNLSVGYEYDADGLRLSKSVNGEVTYYAWDHDHLVMEETEDKVVTYIYGLDLVSRIPDSMYENAEYYLHDAHGNVTQLTNQYGSVTTSYIYDAFGNQLNTGNGSEDDDNPFRYCGEYFDEETGTYYLRARNYVPDLGRFTQWDSYNGDLTIPASLNHYVYCYSDPIGYVDPMGHWAETGLDLASAVLSAHDFDEDPSFINGLLLGWDAFALFAPAIPALGTIKHLDDVADVGKVVDKGVDVVEAIGRATTTRANHVTENEKLQITRGVHATIRVSQGRKISNVIGDVNHATPSKIFLQDDGRYVVRGKNGRVHILESNGEIVTTMNSVTNFDDRIRKGKYSPLTENQKIKFVSEFDQYLNNSWDRYRNK